MQMRRLLAVLLFMSLKLRTPLLLFMLGFILTNFDCHIIMLPICNTCNCGTNNPWRRLSGSLLWLDEGENRALLTNLNSPGSRGWAIIIKKLIKQKSERKLHSILTTSLHYFCWKCVGAKKNTNLNLILWFKALVNVRP